MKYLHCHFFIFVLCTFELCTVKINHRILSIHLNYRKYLENTIFVKKTEYSEQITNCFSPHILFALFRNIFDKQNVFFNSELSVLLSD